MASIATVKTAIWTALRAIVNSPAEVLTSHVPRRHSSLGFARHPRRDLGGVDQCDRRGALGEQLAIGVGQFALGKQCAAAAAFDPAFGDDKAGVGRGEIADLQFKADRHAVMAVFGDDGVV